MGLTHFAFGERFIGLGYPALVIAEIGINHEGDVATCCKMVERAAKAGADAVKLQTSDPEENYFPGSESYELYQNAFLVAEETARVFDCAKSCGIEIFTTTGIKTYEWVEKLNPAGYKISSGTLSNLPLVKTVAKSGRAVLLSTGISPVEEVDQAVDCVKAHGSGDYAVMQCTSLYPAPDDTLDLNTIPWYAERYKVPVGFSDHTLGYDATSIAVALGASVIEKHFTLDRSRPSYDHAISLDAESFAEFVNRIRQTEQMLGSREKILHEPQKQKAMQMQRYMVFNKKLSKGATVSEADFYFLRINDTNSAIKASDYSAITGRILSDDVDKYMVATQSHFEAA